MLRSISIIVALAMAGPLSAQHRHDAVGNGTGSPREIGQASFAALAEIVAILRADTSTDWASVDLAALRRHLVDMDLVTIQAQVTRVSRPEGTRYEIRGGGRVLQAIRAMVPAHAPFLAAETRWRVTTELLDDGVALIVDGDAAQIRGLGFFGLMTIGAHHKEHHLMIAKGAAFHQ